MVVEEVCVWWKYWVVGLSVRVGGVCGVGEWMWGVGGFEDGGGCGFICGGSRGGREGYV